MLFATSQNFLLSWPKDARRILYLDKAKHVKLATAVILVIQ